MTVYPMKCRIRNESGGTTRVDVYDDIGGGGWFSGGISAGDFAGQIKDITGPLEVHVNSGGGDVFDGIAIGNSIRAHKGPVTTVIDGLAASIASVITQAGQDRVIQPGAMMMIHDAFGACMGNATEMAKTAQTLDEVSGNLAGIYADRAGKGTPQSWRDAMKAETWYTAQEAVDAGLADKVGTGSAELPPGLDVAAFTAIPGRIAASLRTLPVAAAGSDGPPCKTCGGTGRLKHATTGKPGITCPGCNGSGTAPAADEGDGGNGEGAPSGPGDAAAAAGDCPTCDGSGKIMEGHRECPDCKGTGKAAPQDALTLESVLAAVRAEFSAAAPASHNHPGQACWDPDGDGDCDLTPEGDTDHDYWSEDGKQLKSVPGRPMPASDDLAGAIRAVLVDEGLLPGADGYIRPGGAAVDNSEWDASKAWHAGAESDNPAGFYAGICAGEKAGDKSTQDAWALPYKYSPSSPVNAQGVRNALSRLPQTQGLTNEAEAKATLQKAMKQVNPDWEPDDSTDPDLSGIDLEQIRAALRGATE